MIHKIQNFILEIHNITSSNFGLYLVLGIVCLWFSLGMLYSLLIQKNFKNKGIFEKILFLPALAITSLLIVDFVFAGDIPADMTAQEMANHFTYYLCEGNLDDLIERKEKVFTSEYYNKFVGLYENRSNKDIDFVGCNSELQEVVEYHWQAGDLNKENVLRNSSELRDRYETTLIFPKVTMVNEQDFEFQDYFFRIHLRKIVLTSKYLGNYPRWRISNFSYDMSDPYTANDVVKEMEGIAEAYEKMNKE